MKANFIIRYNQHNDRQYHIGVHAQLITKVHRHSDPTIHICSSIEKCAIFVIEITSERIYICFFRISNRIIFRNLNRKGIHCSIWQNYQPKFRIVMIAIRQIFQHKKIVRTFSKTSNRKFRIKQLDFVTNLNRIRLCKIFAEQYFIFWSCIFALNHTINIYFFCF